MYDHRCFLHKVRKDKKTEMKEKSDTKVAYENYEHAQHTLVYPCKIIFSIWGAYSLKCLYFETILW